MPRFAVYYIPPVGSELYRRGSAILGYDVRAEKLLPAENPIRGALPNFDEATIRKPQPYGMHCTIYGAPHCRAGDFVAMTDEIETILASFNPATEFALHAHEEFISFWGTVAVLRYIANPALLMLHTLLVAKLVRYVSDSHSYRRLQQNPTQYSPTDQTRIRHFHYPHIFDAFEPHFTLLSPFNGEQNATKTALTDLFTEYRSVAVNSICLLVLDDGAKHWRIYREFEC